MNRIYYVLPLETGGWKIVTNRPDPCATEHPEQNEAIEQAKNLALNDKNARIVVHSNDGSIQQKMGFGND